MKNNNNNHNNQPVRPPRYSARRQLHRISEPARIASTDLDFHYIAVEKIGILCYRSITAYGLHGQHSTRCVRHRFLKLSWNPLKLDEGRSHLEVVEDLLQCAINGVRRLLTQSRHGMVQIPLLI